MKKKGNGGIKLRMIDSISAPLIKKCFFRREKKITARSLSLITKGLWQMFGPERAKSMLYYLGRLAGRDIALAVEQDYLGKKVGTWEDVLSGIAFFSDLFVGAKVKVVSADKNSAKIRIYGSPACYKLRNMEQPCCDFIAGAFASAVTFELDSAQATCTETTCQAMVEKQLYCEFAIEVDWSK